MQSRHAFIILVTLLLIIAVLTGLSQTRRNQSSPATPKAALDNVRDYQAAPVAGGPNYAIDGGLLYVGQPGYWLEIPLPPGIIASAVDVIPVAAHQGGVLPEIIYVGAANELAVYRTSDRGIHWQRGQLTHDVVHRYVTGGVTDLAVDPVQRLIYVGTDKAGIFRVRETGSGLVSSAQLLLDEPVLQVVTDRRGQGLTLARTQWKLYRATDYGLNWLQVDNLLSFPTALAIADESANANGPLALVGTVERGVLSSYDGAQWTPLNVGLALTPATRLYVDALAIDPLQPQVAYVAVSNLFGPTYVHHTPSRIAYTLDGGANWRDLPHQAELTARVSELLPMSGQRGAAYALTLTSRAPQPLGNAPVPPADVAQDTRAAPPPRANSSALLAWVAAGLAAFALAFALITDLISRRHPEIILPNQWTGYPTRRR